MEIALTLDGSHGEGGGQLVRTALSLAVALGRPVRLTRIRARRKRPGLQPQHLTAVRALAAISDADVAGAELHASELVFVPRGVRGGTYAFDVGTAGAVSLVFQSVLLPLVFAAAPSRLLLIGGTHVPWSPPFPYLADVFLPALAEVGVRADVGLARWGWYPRGGGQVEATIRPTTRAALAGFVADACGARPLRGLSAVSRLPRSIAERQQRRAGERLAAAGLPAEIAIAEDATARGPGTLVFLAFGGRAGFSALGRRGLPAEEVADAAVDPLLSYVGTGAAVDEHLADQLVPLLAMGGQRSRFTCPRISSHLETVAWVVERFLPGRVALTPGRPALVDVRPTAG